MKFSRKNDSVKLNLNTNRGRGSLLCIVLILMTIPAVLGADFWEKKAWTEWKDKECDKMLNDSPWAKTYTESKGGNASDTLDGDIPYIKYTVRFSSAYPVRQATIRRLAIANKYDDLNDEQKAAFDQQTNPYLATRYSDVVLIQVVYTTNLRNEEIPLANHWKMQSTEMLKNSTYLYGKKGVKVELLEYIPPSGSETSFQFVFPRMHEEQPIVGPEDKSLQVEFDTKDGSTAQLEFKLNKMTLDGEVVF